MNSARFDELMSALGAIQSELQAIRQALTPDPGTTCPECSSPLVERKVHGEDHICRQGECLREDAEGTKHRFCRCGECGATWVEA